MVLFQAEAKKAEQQQPRMGQSANMGGAQMNSGYGRGQYGYSQQPAGSVKYLQIKLIHLYDVVYKDRLA